MSPSRNEVARNRFLDVYIELISSGGVDAVRSGSTNRALGVGQGELDELFTSVDEVFFEIGCWTSIIQRVALQEALESDRPLGDGLRAAYAAFAVLVDSHRAEHLATLHIRCAEATAGSPLSDATPVRDHFLDETSTWLTAVARHHRIAWDTSLDTLVRITLARHTGLTDYLLSSPDLVDAAELFDYAALDLAGHARPRSHPGLS